ncbi:MAG: hypothetical protein ACM34I_05625 [bacterium]
MRRMKTLFSLLGSKTLTLWLSGIIVFYYLTAAVWFKEAFATFVGFIENNPLFQLWYVLFFLNISIRIFLFVKKEWHAKRKLFFKLPVSLGLVILLFSFFMSINVREFRWLLLGEGDPVDIPWESTSLRVVKVDPAIEKNLLRTDDSRIFNYEPVITLADRFNTLYRIGAYPPRKIGRTYMHVLNFGIGPGVELAENDKEVSKGYVALRLIPFGNVDSFEMPPYPYKFSLTVLPNKVVTRGAETAREYDIEHPLYEVQVAKGDRIILKGEASEQPLSFDGSMSLRFFTPSYWVLLEVAYDPFLLWFLAGIVLSLAGLFLYPFHYFIRNASL